MLFQLHITTMNEGGFNSSKIRQNGSHHSLKVIVVLHIIHTSRKLNLNLVEYILNRTDHLTADWVADEAHDDQRKLLYCAQ